MNNITILVILNAITVAGVLAKIILEFLRGDDNHNRLGVQNLTLALNEAKLEIARLQERLEALNKHMAAFADVWTQMNLMSGRLTRLEEKMNSRRVECKWDESLNEPQHEA